MVKFVVAVVAVVIVFVISLITKSNGWKWLMRIGVLVIISMAAKGTFDEALANPGVVQDMFLGASVKKEDPSFSEKKEPAARLVEWNTIKLQEDYQRITPLKCNASSYLVMEEENLKFTGDNTIDGKTKTSWQDGKENEDAIGETLTYLFDAPCSIDFIVLRNGNAMADENYYNNSRIRKLKIYDNNGHSVTVLLEDVNNWQQIELAGFEDLTELVFEVVSEYEGSLYKDTCVSEVEFYGK